MTSNLLPSRAALWTLYPPLNSVSAPTVDTSAAAYYLGRQPQTLREWACRQTGPIHPLRINGRLAWPTAKLREILREAI